MNSETVSSSSLRGSSDRCHWVATPRRRPRGDFRCVVVGVVLTRCAALGLIWFLILIHFDRVFLSCFFSIFFRCFTEFLPSWLQQINKPNGRRRIQGQSRDVIVAQSKQSIRKKRNLLRKKKKRNTMEETHPTSTKLDSSRDAHRTSLVFFCSFFLFVSFRFFLSFVIFIFLIAAGGILGNWIGRWMALVIGGQWRHRRTMTSPADNDVTRAVIGRFRTNTETSLSGKNLLVIDR